MSCLLLQAAAYPAFMDFGFSEIMLIGIVALLVFGGNLPDIMRSLGRSYAKLRSSLHEFSRPVRDEMRQVKKLDHPGLPTGSQPREPEYPEYGGPPITSTPEDAELPAADDQDASAAGGPADAEPSASEVSAPAKTSGEAQASGVADEPPPV